MSSADDVLVVAVPCHHVVGADGQVSGHRWAMERKRALLERERASSDDAIASGPGDAQDGT